MRNNKSHTNFEPSLIVALLMLLVFTTPLTRWWSSIGLPWYVPYLAWLAIIILCAAGYRRTRNK